MKKNNKLNMHWFFMLILSLVFLSGNAQVTDNLKMVWNDEFNGSSLDATKWAPAPEWPRQGGSYWSDNNYEMTGNGQVKLQVTEENGTVYCGAIRTHNKFDQKYGYFETRCKLPEIQGGWAAFWLMPYGNKPGGWGDDGTEMDVFESINGWNGKINHALHWDGYGAEHQKSSQSTSRPDLYDGQYHIFGMMWTPDEYIFYIDNVESWRTNAGGVADVNQYLKLTLEVSNETWAGDWNKQVTKPIDWLIDYVRVYDYQPVSASVNLDFSILEDNQNFNVGDQVQMHVDVTGTLSQIDEIKFFTQKGVETDILRTTTSINTETTYWYNWFPSEVGSYKLKAKGYKNGIYITNVVVNAIVQDQKNPLSLSFETLDSGASFTTGEPVEMNVLVSGDLKDADELQFLTKKGDEDFILQNLVVVGSATSYNYTWIPNQSGTYIFRVTANKNSSYVTHVVANGTVEGQMEPFSLNFVNLLSGVTFQEGEDVSMDIELSGDLSAVDEFQFLTKNGEGEFIEETTISTNGVSTYSYNWTASEPGDYTLRVTARNNNSYVTHVVVNNVTIEKSLEPFSISFTNLLSGDIFQGGEDVSMDIELSGDLSGVDELQFLTKSGDGEFSEESTISTNGSSTYSYDWTPSESGNYGLRVTAKNNNSYVTHVVVNDVIIEESLEPLSLNYTVLEPDETYNVGDKVKMHVALSGDISTTDELRFILQKTGESALIIKTSPVSLDETTYWNKWFPTEAGSYKLKVSAYKNGSYLTHVTAFVTIEDPLRLNYRVLQGGETYSIGDEVKMHVDVLGDFSQADDIRFFVQKSGEEDMVIKTTVISSDVVSYYKKWTPSETGDYTLKVKAFKDGVYVINTVVNVTVLQITNLNKINTKTKTNSNLNLGLSIYPNPVTEFLTIETDSEDVKYQVVTISGQIVLEGKGKAIDVTNLSTGKYLLIVNNHLGTEFIKE